MDKSNMVKNTNMGVSKNSGTKTTKMDGENNGKPYEQMDDLGFTTPIFGNTHIILSFQHYSTTPRKIMEQKAS